MSSHQERDRQGQATRRRILGYIGEYQGEHGWAPTVREIASAVGLASPSTVQKHLTTLRDQGELVLGNGPRMIRLQQGTIELQRPAPQTVEGHRLLGADGRLEPGRR